MTTFACTGRSDDELVEPAERFDQIKPSVEASLGVEISEVDLVAGSVANLDFRVDLADGRRVFVKTGPRAELVAEAWAIGQAAAAGVPVPDVAAYEDRAAVTPVPFLAVELLPSDGLVTARVAQEVGRAMKLAHSHQLPGYGPVEVAGDPLDPDSVRGRYGSWREFIASIVNEIDELVRVGLMTVDLGDSVRRHAAQIEPSPLVGEAGVLLHADLKRDHLLAVDGGLSGIIDWGDASSGDPAWDLARASMMSPAEFDPLIEAYLGADRDAVTQILPVYRVLWNTRALSYEYRAGGDWFAEYQRRIAEDLDLL